VRYCIQAEETGDDVTPLLTVPEFQQRLLRFDGSSGERKDDDRDEVLYVLEGGGAVTVGGERREVEPGAAVFVARGTPWQVDSSVRLEILSVLVEDPLPASAAHAVIAGGERGAATAGREFTLLAHPENGCESVTQFVGYIPVGRAPARLRAGSCVHLPAGLIHCLENSGPGEMRVLGVFRPAGSPAEAYYPDGTAAVVAAA
jgi:mannose-6-phosphate isomerase-like protein (cupin superfamily)